jgi:hypothetical protein
MEDKVVLLLNDEYIKIIKEFVNDHESHPLGPLVWHIEHEKWYKDHPSAPNWKYQKTFESYTAAHVYSTSLTRRWIKDAENGNL